MVKPAKILELEKEYDIVIQQITYEHSRLENSFYVDNDDNIKSLNLSGNQISDISILSDLNAIVNLDLSRNKISDLSILNGLKNLQVLNLESNNISDIPVFDNLKKLKTLNLNDNEIFDILNLSCIDSLVDLSLDNNQLSSILFLDNFISLECLSLNFNDINEIVVLGDLGLLTSLSVWGNKFYDLSFLNDLQSLKVLSLWNNKITDLSRLKGLVLLERLDLGENEISDIAVLENLRLLNDLDLSGNRVSNISVLENLKLLEDLNLSDNQISDISVLEDLKLLEDLNLSENKISDFSILSNLQSLTKLTLDKLRISDLSILNDLRSIKELSLNNNLISNISILKNFTSLVNLQLRDNRISDISSLKNLSKLRLLNLRGNKISKIKVLGNLEKIVNVNLTDNEINSLNEFDFLLSKRLYIEGGLNPCFNNYEVKFESNNNHYDLILNLLKKLKEEKREYILPAKVLLLGNTGCGKSTILDYLLQEEKHKVFRNNIESTHIIQVKTRPQIIKRNQIPEAVFYDFGGQDYYHGLYKAFLSNDSLNILLWNSKNDKNQIRKDRNDQFTRDYNRNYWLHQLKFQYRHFNHKKTVIKREPIILVQSHADDDLNNRETYKENFDSFNIINEFYLSLNSDAIKGNKIFDIGLRYFEETLNEQIKQKQILKKEPIWFGEFLTFILKYTKKDYIKLSDLAKEYKRESDKDNYLLPEVLREIAQTGLILYYKDDPDLKDVVWLNPTSIIEDIHNRILSKDVIKINKGIIGQEVFDEIVKDEKIIKLLINQRVIFLDEYDNNYIIPGYLPLTEEEDKLYELLTFDFIEPNFILKFEYFIPFGLINQLICFYGKNKNKKHYWRDQLLFTKDNCKILIKLDFTNLEISVSIKSKVDNQKLDKLQKEIFKNIIDIYWDKAEFKPKWIDVKRFNNYLSKDVNLENVEYVNFENYKSFFLESFKEGDSKPHKIYDNVNIENWIETIWKSTIEDFKGPIVSPDDLYISVDNKYFVNHKDLQNEEKTLNKIMSFGLELKKEMQNDKEVEVRKLNKNLFSEKATGLFKNFTNNKNAENMKRIFISYAKENKKQVNEFLKQIAPFKLTKDVETWHCSELELGEDWNAKIKSKFYEADIILYFVSVDFFSTPFILDEEVKRGIERDNDPADNVVLIPIILEMIHWEDLLGKYSSNFKGKPIKLYEKANNAWYQVVDDLKNQHFRKADPDSTKARLGQSKEKMKAQEDIIEGKL